MNGPELPLSRRLADAGLDWIVPDWNAPVRIGALMTTRNGGVSTGAAATLDLGPTDLSGFDAAVRAAIAANRDRVARFLPAPPRYLRQVHGTAVVRVDAGFSGDVPLADAAFTRDPGVVLAIRVADCLPIVLADRAGTVVGAAHAGWRGLAGGVLGALVAAMHVAPERLVAWIGPGIGPAAFEVGRDVLDAFSRADGGSAAHFVPSGDGKWLADLPALALRALVRLGVSDVGRHPGCTFSEPARFFSYRRDKGAGRMAAFAWITGDGTP